MGGNCLSVQGGYGCGELGAWGSGDIDGDDLRHHRLAVVVVLRLVDIVVQRQEMGLGARI